MVHITPDSRVLGSLVKQEQAYAVQLRNLLTVSGASLSALAVYASTSPPTVSPILTGVAGAFSGADEALRSYGETLNDWINHLDRIRQKEEEVANIVRDREILVTRLLKVSQKSKSPPPSLLHAAADGSSSASFSTFSSKINNAQADLQGCETSLTEKTRELEGVRVHAISQGLKLRCNALIQCGRVWGDMGTRAVELLNGLDGSHPLPNGHATEFYKPLPDPTRDHDHDSIQSSLAPSQSASQICAVPPSSAPLPSNKTYRLDIPPPHLMTETNIIPQTSRPGSSSSSEDEGPVEVHDNPRFNPAPNSQRSKKNAWTAPPSPLRRSPVPFPSLNPDLEPSSKFPRGEKKRASLLGTITALFRAPMSPKSGSQLDSGWKTRTDRTLRGVRTDVAQSSDEEDARLWHRTLRKGKGRPTLSALDDRVVVGPSGADIPARPSDAMVFTPTRRKRGGKLGKNNSIRSTLSEPRPTSRVRANTLNGVPSVPAVQDGSVRSHGRPASMDGRPDLTTVGTDIAPLQTREKSKAKGGSPTKTAESSTANPSSRLEVVRAPGSTIPGLPLLIHPPPSLPGPASAPPSPTASKMPASKRSSMPVPTTTTPGVLVVPAPPIASEKKPLRSAMRKSISPSASPNVRAATDENQSPILTSLALPAASSSSPRPRPVSLQRSGVPSTIIESPRQSLVDPGVDTRRQSYTSTKTDDSISSYETGREDLDDEVTAGTNPARTSSPPVPPPKAESLSPQGPTLQSVGPLDQHEFSSATSTDTAPARRKSVRMSSLPPQVSATPPALDEYSDADHAPWGRPLQQARADPNSGWQSRIPAHEAPLSWEDSSSEEELYKTARKALSRTDRPEKLGAKRKS